MYLIDDLGADQDRVDAKMRPCRVPALSLKVYCDRVGRGHHGTRADREFADRHAGIVVHAENLLDTEAIEQAVPQHRSCARAPLLRRLKNHDGGAGKIAGVRKIFGGAEQHRGMAVMAAGVHLPRHGRFVGEVGRLFDRQRVHVGAQANHLAAGLAAADDANNAGSAYPGDHFVAAEGFELVGNGSRRAVHVVKQFRVGVDIPPPSRDLGVQVGDAVDDRHGGGPRSALPGPEGTV